MKLSLGARASRPLVLRSRKIAGKMPALLGGPCSIIHRDDAAPQGVTDEVGLCVQAKLMHEVGAVRFCGA
ncbi:MAG: hypothetical protein V7641_369 [Blastocatellia bacterium]